MAGRPSRTGDPKTEQNRRPERAGPTPPTGRVDHLERHDPGQLAHMPWREHTGCYPDRPCYG
ncbi:hypothetical protein ABZ566_37330, partial [Streptomyces hygroscopicus]|uniref:hypothetical protein n=1 Tax=Streptomyces hygroscopicus TaxID=1912 RepID=UPI0033D70FCA